MKLVHEFAQHQLDAVLESFLEAGEQALREQLLCVILHGSVVFGDLAPGYGDLDFLAVVARDLSEHTCTRLTLLRRPFRAGEHGAFGTMLEGAFLPRHLLDPARTGRALWWGTSGERSWERNKLGLFAHEVIRNHGIVIWGEDLRGELPAASRQDLLAEVHTNCLDIRRHGRGGGLHSVDWLLTAARLLLWLKEGRLSSKSDAAEWAHAHAAGPWREHLPRAKQIRLSPQLAEPADAQLWLSALTEPIQQACDEVQQELRTIGGT